MRSSCEVQHQCKTCALDHHELICFQGNTSNSCSDEQVPTAKKKQATTSTSVTTAAETSHGEAENGSASAQGSLFAIESVKAAGSDKKATLFFDNGSNTTYITHRAARRLGANKLSGSQALQVLSLGGVTKQ